MSVVYESHGPSLAYVLRRMQYLSRERVVAPAAASMVSMGGGIGEGSGGGLARVGSMGSMASAAEGGGLMSDDGGYGFMSEDGRASELGSVVSAGGGEVMYKEDGEMIEACRSHALSWRWVTLITKQLVQALAHIHDKANLIHGDPHTYPHITRHITSAHIAQTQHITYASHIECLPFVECQ